MLFVCVCVCFCVCVFLVWLSADTVGFLGKQERTIKGRIQCLASSRRKGMSCYKAAQHILASHVWSLKLVSRCSCYHKVVAMLSLLQNSMEMPVVEKNLHGESIKGNLVLRHGHWLARGPKIVWLVQKRPGQKVLTGHITHSTDSGRLPREETLLRSGRHCWARMGLLNSIHTPGYGVSSDVQSGGLETQKYNRKQIVPAVKKNRGKNAVPRDFSSRPVTCYCVVESCDCYCLQDIKQEL